MHVIANRFEVAVATAIHDQRLVAPGKDVAAKLVANVESLGIDPQQPFHTGDQIGLGSLDHQMKMIAH